eukprot:9673480-Lingulodinium_polyedra.AAC.1
MAMVMDMLKAFETVVEVGRVNRFPRNMFNIICKYFAMTRRVIFEQCFSEELRACCAILAGSRWSVTHVQMAGIWPVRKVLRLYPGLGVK